MMIDQQHVINDRNVPKEQLSGLISPYMSATKPTHWYQLYISALPRLNQITNCLTLILMSITGFLIFTGT